MVNRSRAVWRLVVALSVVGFLLLGIGRPTRASAAITHLRCVNQRVYATVVVKKLKPNTRYDLLESWSSNPGVRGSRQTFPTTDRNGTLNADIVESTGAGVGDWGYRLSDPATGAVVDVADAPFVCTGAQAATSTPPPSTGKHTTVPPTTSAPRTTAATSSIPALVVATSHGASPPATTKPAPTPTVSATRFTSRTPTVSAAATPTSTTPSAATARPAAAARKPVAPKLHAAPIVALGAALLVGIIALFVWLWRGGWRPFWMASR